jgi:hypothetical protein
MIEQGADTAILKNASREDACEWVAESWGEITEEIVNNSWRKTGFSYFL